MRLARTLLALLLAAPAAAQVRSVPRVPSGLAVPAAVPRLAAPALSPSALAPSLSAASLTPALPAPAAGPSFSPDVAPALAAPQAGPPVAAAPVPRRLDQIRSLRIGTYNVLNLFQKVGKHERRADGSLERVSGPVDKEEQSRRDQAKAILDEGLDVVVLQEVENIAALEQFVAEHLGGAYRAFLIEGNDERGIDVAFLVKTDLPFEVEQRSRKHETWNDPAQGGREAPLFSRDLTSLVIRAAGRAEPLAVLFGTHMKSKRDRPGDPDSELQRRAQAKRTAEILAQTREEFGPGVPVLIAGDFNGDLTHDEALRPIFDAGFVDGFDAAPVPTAPEDRVSHTYHPRDGAAQAHQMDGVVISKDWARLVRRTHAHRYKDERGRDKPIPATYAERSRNPSDHFPVVLELDFAGLLAAQEEGARFARDMAAAQAVQLATLRPLAARLGLDATAVSLLGSALGVAPTLRDLLDDARALRLLRATPQEAEEAVAASVARARLETGPDGKPTRDSLENLLLQHREASSAVEIRRNGFFLSRERERGAGWSYDLSDASWEQDGTRLLVRLGTARRGSESRVLGVSFELSIPSRQRPSERVAAVAAWGGLDAGSVAALRRVSAGLAAAGF